MTALTITTNNLKDHLKQGNSQFMNCRVIVSNWTLNELESHKEKLYALLYYAAEVVIENCERGIEKTVRGLVFNASVVVAKVRKVASLISAYYLSVVELLNNVSIKKFKKMKNQLSFKLHPFKMEPDHEVCFNFFDKVILSGYSDKLFVYFLNAPDEYYAHGGWSDYCDTTLLIAEKGQVVCCVELEAYIHLDWSTPEFEEFYQNLVRTRRAVYLKNASELLEFLDSWLLETYLSPSERNCILGLFQKVEDRKQQAAI
jgi:hypothetical protein